tara:strand:- start:8038 stop:8970 length:933 start_codon:yes stop_codon:yes gene_type:complete
MKEYIIRKIISQKNNKYQYQYYDKNNNIISNKKALSLIPSIYIPPAYDNVKISLNPKSKVLAIGEDNKHRKQYIYHKRIIKKNSNKKFCKLINLGKIYPKIIKQINHDSKQCEDLKLKHISTIIRIIIDCNFRVGNQIYEKENKSYGVTTLKIKHLTFNKNNIMIKFNGKKNVVNKCKLTHKQTIKNIKDFKKNKRLNQHIFSFKDSLSTRKISSNDINNYLQQFGDYTSKNIRTWRANTLLIKYLLQKLSIKESIQKVAESLHNTPSVCKSNYLDPKLITYYEKNPNLFINFFKSNINKKYISFLKLNY